VSETCYRYSPLLSNETEAIADLLVGPHGRLGGLGYVCYICAMCRAIRGPINGSIIAPFSCIFNVLLGQRDCPALSVSEV
jgi:hypothetical protein